MGSDRAAKPVGEAVSSHSSHFISKEQVAMRLIGPVCVCPMLIWRVTASVRRANNDFLFVWTSVSLGGQPTRFEMKRHQPAKNGDVTGPFFPNLLLLSGWQLFLLNPLHIIFPFWEWAMSRNLLLKTLRRMELAECLFSLQPTGYLQPSALVAIFKRNLGLLPAPKWKVGYIIHVVVDCKMVNILRTGFYGLLRTGWKSVPKATPLWINLSVNMAWEMLSCLFSFGWNGIHDSERFSALWRLPWQPFVRKSLWCPCCSGISKT